MTVVVGLFCFGFIYISSCGLVCGNVESEDEEWVDPYDMLNYDAVTKSMRKPAEASMYGNTPTKRREYKQDSCQVAQCPDMKECMDKANMLQKELEERTRREMFSSHQPTCNPLFKRYLAKLLKEIEKLGLPTAVSAVVHYDAEVKLSKQMVAEIRKIVNNESSWRTGVLDDALSQILINFKLHDDEAWKWHFEDTFGVELDTIVKVSVFVMIIVVIVCTELWSVVSWFVQFKRMFAICFIISLVWNWFYLYKIAFAEHQANIVKMENVNAKCTGVRKIDWMDNFKEWFRTMWTLQDDPCKQYYEVIFVNPVLLVPPTKAITMTFTTFFTDPLKHIGQGISEFLRALLKDLPITLQIPVLIALVLIILVLVYSTGQAAVHHAVHRPLRGGRQDPPPSITQQPAAQALPEPIKERQMITGNDTSHTVQPIQQSNEVKHTSDKTYQEDNRPKIRQRRPIIPKGEKPKVCVETLGNADSLYSEDDTKHEATAEDLAQLVEDKPRTLSNSPNMASESGTEVKPTQLASKEHDVRRDKKDGKPSGDAESTGRRDSASIGGGHVAKEENCVETIGTPFQDNVQ